LLFISGSIRQDCSRKCQADRALSFAHIHGSGPTSKMALNVAPLNSLPLNSAALNSVYVASIVETVTALTSDRGYGTSVVKEVEAQLLASTLTSVRQVLAKMTETVLDASSVRGTARDYSKIVQTLLVSALLQIPPAPRSVTMTEVVKVSETAHSLCHYVAKSVEQTLLREVEKASRHFSMTVTEKMLDREALHGALHVLSALQALLSLREAMASKETAKTQSTEALKVSTTDRKQVHFGVAAVEMQHILDSTRLTGRLAVGMTETVADIGVTLASWGMKVHAAETLELLEAVKTLYYKFILLIPVDVALSFVQNQPLTPQFAQNNNFTLSFVRNQPFALAFP